MKWPTVDQIAAMVTLPPGFRFEFLRRSDVPELIDNIARWHPDIAIGGGSCYLRERFYDDEVQLEDGQDRNVMVALFRRGDEMAGMWSWEKRPESLSLYARLIVIAPEHRSAKLGTAVMPLAELVGRKMGAEFFFGFATLKIPHMQHALESVGWQLIGFTSGYDQEQVSPGVVKRVFEAVYCKVLVPEEELVRPDPKNLTPRVRALFEAIFPAEDPTQGANGKAT
jgi:GNAT superfamily N-acetyltransferase